MLGVITGLDVLGFTVVGLGAGVEGAYVSSVGEAVSPFLVGAVVTGFKVGAGVGSHFTGGMVGLGEFVVSSTNFTSNEAPSTLVIVTWHGEETSPVPSALLQKEVVISPDSALSFRVSNV